MTTASEGRRKVAHRVGVAGVVAAATAAVVLGGVAPARAAGAQTYTQHVHGLDQLDPDFGPNPCTGDPVTGTQRENLVDHETVMGGQLRGTFTEEAWLDITDTGTGVTYTGHYTAWGDYNLNRQNQTSTFTFSADLVGSDGSTIAGHEVTQFVLRPDGTVQVDFDKAQLSCESSA